MNARFDLKLLDCINCPSRIGEVTQNTARASAESPAWAFLFSRKTFIQSNSSRYAKRFTKPKI